MNFEPWPDNLPVDEQIDRLATLLMEHYRESFDRSEGAMEKAARLLTEHVVIAADCADCRRNNAAWLKRLGFTILTGDPDETVAETTGAERTES